MLIFLQMIEAYAENAEASREEKYQRMVESASAPRTNLLVSA